jgi:hypothetical protein
LPEVAPGVGDNSAAPSTERPTTEELLEGILAECKEWHETTPAQASKHTVRILMKTLEVLIFNEVRTQHPPKHHE